MWSDFLVEYKSVLDTAANPAVETQQLWAVPATFHTSLFLTVFKFSKIPVRTGNFSSWVLNIGIKRYSYFNYFIEPSRNVSVVVVCRLYEIGSQDNPIYIVLTSPLTNSPQPPPTSAHRNGFTYTIFFFSWHFVNHSSSWKTKTWAPSQYKDHLIYVWQFPC